MIPDLLLFSRDWNQRECRAAARRDLAISIKLTGRSSPMSLFLYSQPARTIGSPGRKVNSEKRSASSDDARREMYFPEFATIQNGLHRYYRIDRFEFVRYGGAGSGRMRLSISRSYFPRHRKRILRASRNPPLGQADRARRETFREMARKSHRFVQNAGIIRSVHAAYSRCRMCSRRNNGRRRVGKFRFAARVTLFRGHLLMMMLLMIRAR